MFVPDDDVLVEVGVAGVNGVVAVDNKNISYERNGT